MVDQSMNVNDLKITFYSTSPPEFSKSKYPKQNKTSYRMPSSAMSTSTNITVPAHVQEEPLASHRSLPREKRKTDANKKNDTQKVIKEKKQNTTIDTTQPTRSHPIRIRTAPKRYEPVETVTDDYSADENDSESEYSSD